MRGKWRQRILTREMHTRSRALYSCNLTEIISEPEESEVLCYVRPTDTMTDFAFASKSMCINRSPAPSTRSLSGTPWGKINSLIRSDKELAKKIWNYEDDYLKYRFTSAIINKPPPNCTLCLEILANDSMKPSWLARHLKTKHPEHEDKYLQILQHWFQVMQCSI